MRDGRSGGFVRGRLPVGGNRRTGAGWVAGLGSVLFLAGAASPAAGQAPGCGGPAGAPAQVEEASLGLGPWACAGMLLEKTIFNVDVLELTLRFDTATAGRLHDAAAREAGNGEEREALADRLVELVLEADEVLVRTRFRRNISLDQFVDGAEESIELALAADMVPEEAARATVSGMREVYGGFAERGFRKDDCLWYHIRGDELHIVVEGAGGEILDEVRSRSPHVRGATLGGYLAPGSDFRDGLLRSLAEGTGAG